MVGREGHTVVMMLVHTIFGGFCLKSIRGLELMAWQWKNQAVIGPIKF